MEIVSPRLDKGYIEVLAAQKQGHRKLRGNKGTRNTAMYTLPSSKFLWELAAHEGKKVTKKQPKLDQNSTRKVYHLYGN